MHVKSLMGFRILRSWGVDKRIPKSAKVRVLLENHAQFQKQRPFCFKIFSIRRKSEGCNRATLPNPAKSKSIVRKGTGKKE